MPDDPVDEPADTAADGGRVFSGFGIGSAALGAIAVVAVVLLGVVWSVHHDRVDERGHQTRVLQAATDWTGLLINMNKDTVDATLAQLQDGTVGQLNSDFDSSIEPYRDVVRTLQTKSAGQIEAVAIESLHRDIAPDGAPVRPAAPPPADPFATSTDTVLVVATSVSQNTDGKPRTVRWNLRLEVAEVEGRLLISHLESIR